MKGRFVQFFGAIVMLSIANSCSSPNEKKPGEQMAPAEPAHKIYTVEIRQMKFEPETITVKEGDKIVFVNHDLVNHDVTEDEKTWSSSTLEPEKYWAMTATKSQNYYCSLHMVMKGKIIVE